VKTGVHAAAAGLSNADLFARLEALAESGRASTAELVAHLVELEARRAYLVEGYGSLFAYCTGALRLSEHVAYNCLEATRTARKLPAVLDRLSSGDLNLNTLRILGPYLTPENHEAVLDEAAGRGKRHAEVIAARLAPMPDVPAFLRKLPARTWMPATAPAPVACGTPTDPPAARPALSPRATPEEPAAAVTSPASPGLPALPPQAPPAIGAPQASWPPPSPLPPRSGHPVVAPLTPDRFRVQFTMGKETHEKLRFAQDMLRREIPDGDPAAIFDRALTLLLEEVARTKMAATASPGPDRITAPGSRHIPAAVKRAVWFRDRGQCAFVSAQGRRCEQRSYLELHHIHPFALGGEATVGNIALRCQRHNALESELVFGPLDRPVVH